MTARRIRVSPRKLLLATVSAMALSIGSAHAVAITVGDATEASPFFFGDKKVSFDPSACTDCAGAVLTALGGSDIGFRISFGTPSSQSVFAQALVSGTGTTGADDTSTGLLLPQSLGFTVMTTNPLFQIIGVSMSADAGVTASYDWQSNSEDFSAAVFPSSARASGDIDLSLSNGTEIANLNTVFDVSVADLSIFGTASDSADSTATGGPVGGALTPSGLQVLTLNWDMIVGVDCSTDNLIRPSCTANADAFITSIDVRFEQVPEPATLGLMGAGLIGLGWFRRRRRAG